MHSSRSGAVHRARDRQTGAPVVLKIAKPGAGNVSKLRCEGSILGELQVPGVIRLLGLEEGHGGEVALVLDHHGGEPLAARLAAGPLPLADALHLGVEIAAALGHIHGQRIIHKDIHPSNILIDEGGHAWLFDFDVATRLPREVHGICTPSQLVGTLTYISPEQTGRMNRVIEYRTDLYSLGVTLYHALTGQVPFSSSDPIELIHAHIAKTPTPPSEVDPRIPKPVSDVIMKLLEKMPEARYQSAFGLKADLEECLRRLEQDGRVDAFLLGQHDLSDHFQIPQKLYGRAEEIATLEGAFARAKQGAPELLLVTGSSGIGKSSVIQELYKSLAQTRGHFISGKFDELKRDIPFSALLQALSELVRSLLAEPEEQVALIRKRILTAVSGAGRVLTDVLPDLEHLIGAQPVLPALDAAEAKNRFRIAFEAFIHELHRHGQPLVIFLDDLQWADAATLDLLPTLIGNAKAGSLLVIGAYRDNEIQSGHLLLATLAAMERANHRITRIALPPIPVTAVRELVEGTLAIGPEEALPLAELLWNRTEGNPLFVGELLSMLHRNGLIEIDRAGRRWTFDLARIERASSVDSVGQLLAARAATLSEQGQHVLRLAAVLGNRFDLDSLTMVATRSAEETKRALEEALQEGLVLSTSLEDQDVYCFLHDRVQQTVYALIPEEVRVELHYQTGQLLLRSRPPEDTGDRLFNVLHHLNMASGLVRSQGERLEIARLNLIAAKRAKASGAFAAAAALYQAGIAFMPEGSWTSHHDAMFTLHLGQAESESLAGAHGSAERLFDVLRKQSASATTTARTTTLDAPSLIKACQALSGEISLNKLLLSLMKIVAENAGAERGLLILHQQGALVVAAEFSVREGARLLEQRVPVTDQQDLSQGIVNHVFRTRETIVLGNAPKDGPFTADAYVLRVKPRALLCTPLLQKGEVVGVLYLENNLIADAFTTDRAELLHVLCAQMAISIDNALLHGELEQKVIERTRELREAQAHLIRLEKEATENHMVGGFAHEMRNALAVAKLVLAKVYRSSGANGEPWSVCLDNSQKMMDVFLRVRDHIPDETLDDISVLLAEMNKGEAQVDASLRNISGSLERGLGITAFILKYAQVGLDQPEREVISMPVLINSMVSSLQDDFDANRITVEVDIPSDCTLMGDEVHFSSIFSNLILNARDAIVEAADVGQPRKIQIRAEEAVDSMIISVIDTGVGIPLELHEKIFEPFFSTKLTTGTGLGLGMVRKLTSIHGGTVEFDSIPQHGATFRVTFPKKVELSTPPTGISAMEYVNPVSARLSIR